MNDVGATQAPLVWSETNKLLASDAEADDRLGSAVAISGDWAIVGAYGEDSVASLAGAAYIYYRHQGGPDHWGQVQKLIASDAEQDDWFGYALAISGDTAIAGAWAEDVNMSGAAYLFGRNVGGPNNWGEIRKIISLDRDSGDRFGISVAIDGDVAIVGANGDDGITFGTGAAYIFYRDQGGPNNWGQVCKLEASDAEMNDQFGYRRPFRWRLRPASRRLGVSRRRSVLHRRRGLSGRHLHRLGRSMPRPGRRFQLRRVVRRQRQQLRC